MIPTKHKQTIKCHQLVFALLYPVGHTEIVDLLISAGAELDMVDCDGKAALHLACTENHYEVVVQLLRSDYQSINHYFFIAQVYLFLLFCLKTKKFRAVFLAIRPFLSIITKG